MRRTLVAVAVLGPHNLTRVTSALPLSDDTLASFARIVAANKTPERLYYVVEVRDSRRGWRKAGILYRWHVGEGFAHADGWWVEAE